VLGSFDIPMSKRMIFTTMCLLERRLLRIVAKAGEDKLMVALTAGIRCLHILTAQMVPVNMMRTEKPGES